MARVDPIGHSALGTGQENHPAGQIGSVVRAQFATVDDLQQGRRVDRIAFAVRHAQREANQLAILLDDPPQNPRRNEKDGRIDGPDGLLDLRRRPIPIRSTVLPGVRFILHRRSHRMFTSSRWGRRLRPVIRARRFERST